MTTMRYFSILLLISILSFSCTKQQIIANKTPEERTASALASRIVPRYAENILFVQTADSVDVFELYNSGKKLVIKGNNANSMAMGLNHYLKNYCDVTVSWHEFDPVEYPPVMPLVEIPIRVEARTQERFFLNYCTFGYTMPWWKWEDWERLIDWMALNGVTMPLATSGQEAIWQKIWMNHGLTDEEVRSYFTGPAHLAWHRMTNIDKFDGPLPQGWIDSQVDLQKKILKRERELNMTPVLPAFTGHVPEKIKEIYPDAQITRVPGWGGFEEEYLCHFLSPTDSLFTQIQREYLEAQTELFGTDHIYGMDLFNEIEAPSWDPETLAKMSSSAYESLTAVDPEAKWLQMGWMFYYDRDHWTPENIKAYLGAVPQGKVIILDYYLENTMVWKLTESFFGQPYILCYLGNFGGNTRLAGHFRETSDKIEETIAFGGENCIGIGTTLEGFGVNHFMFEYIFDKAWNLGQSDDQWVETLASRRLGRDEATAVEAWKTLCDSVYIRGSFSSQVPLSCARPCLEGYWHWTAIHTERYDNDILVRTWKKLLETPSDRDSYKFDIVNLGTQALGNHFVVLRDELTAAYRSGDIGAVISAGEKIMHMHRDIDKLASCHPQLRLDKWIADAEAMALNDEEKAYYARNARTIVTTWGHKSNIRDYAARQWSGLVHSYYAPRWDMYINELASCLEEGREYDQDKFFRQLEEFENNWAINGGSTLEYGPMDAYVLCQELAEKWF